MKALVLLALVGMVVLSVPSVRDQVEQQFYPLKYQAFVEQWAQVYQLDPLLVYSFIRTESGFDPDATSTVEARGLMQMTEETFLWLRSKIAPDEDLTFGDLYDPAVSIRFGCYYLRSEERRVGKQQRCSHGSGCLPQRLGHGGHPAADGGAFLRRADPERLPVQPDAPLCGKDHRLLRRVHPALRHAVSRTKFGKTGREDPLVSNI